MKSIVITVTVPDDYDSEPMKARLTDVFDALIGDDGIEIVAEELLCPTLQYVIMDSMS